MEKVALGHVSAGNVALGKVCGGKKGTRRGLCWKMWH